MEGERDKGIREIKKGEEGEREKEIESKVLLEGVETR